jgi:site-specific DNA-methyltransferase (adenine-specific)
MTSLMSRRSVYCSKFPNGRYSVSHFDDAEGNVRFKRTHHIWRGEKCAFCGASKAEYDRDDALEQHAYEFIHTTKPEEIFNMKFDVIIGNPPYQLGSNDERKNSRDIPMYHKFVDEAKKLKPRFLSMIIPSRWMATGLGLTDFRRTMLGDKHIRTLVDYPAAKEVFAGVEIKGGVCYFLWDRDNAGDCDVTTIRDNIAVGPTLRDLGEYDVFVRDSRAISILHKVLAKKESSITDILSVDKEFGWTSNFTGFHSEQKNGDVALHYGKSGKRLIGWIERDNITKSVHLIDKWKVMVPQAGSDGGAKIPDSVLSSSFLTVSPSVCTQTYLFFYVDTEKQAKNIQTYVQTRFLRFLVSLRKITQHATRSTYTFVPLQDFSEPWTDEKLYAKYGITAEEQAFIESMIRPMDLGGAGE